MKKYLKRGETIDFVASADHVAGDLILVGDLGAFIEDDVKNGASGVGYIEGVYTTIKDIASGSGANNGKAAYYIASSGKVTGRANDGASPPVVYTKIGKFVDANYADAATTANVKLIPGST